MTKGDLRYDGQTVVITGAGAGLGRAYALFFASRGANVVVNDLGGSFRGEGKEHAAADKVVQEIKALGGNAVANYDDVTNGERIVDAAIQNFGRIDVLINNAGILRDISFKNMKDTDWDLIMKVHVLGAYKCARAAFPYFQKQSYGRLISTASAAGLFGSFGQCNYSAAKLSQVGFTETLAKEGAKYNIMCNVIAPIAASRLTATVLPPDVLEKLKPEFVVPLVAVLTHSSNSTETGGIFEVGGGHMAKFRWERAKGTLLKADGSFTPGALLQKWKEVCNFSQPDYPSHGVSPRNHLRESDEWAPRPSSKSPDYSGKVALITSGCSELGRAYCLQFSRYGAKVAVNDINDSNAIVEEIKQLGGQAVGIKGSPEDSEKIVQAAIDVYGSVDILINIAGILDDAPFSSVDDQTFEQVLRSNLRATYKMTKSAWPHMLKKKFGRIINTSSTSGIYGYPSQVAYATATSGILGFARALALEGKKYNINVNTIATDALINANRQQKASKDQQKLIEYEAVAALGALLCSDMAPEPDTGRLFEYGSGWIGETRWQRSGGHGFPTDANLTPEVVVEKWDTITTFNDGRADNPSDQSSGQGKIMANMEKQTNASDHFSDKAPASRASKL